MNETKTKEDYELHAVRPEYTGLLCWEFDPAYPYTK